MQKIFSLTTLIIDTCLFIQDILNKTPTIAIRQLFYVLFVSIMRSSKEYITIDPGKLGTFRPLEMNHGVQIVYLPWTVMIYASLWLLVLCIMRIRPEVQTYISNNQDKNVSICHLSIDLHIQPIIPYYLDMYYVQFTFLLKTADFILDRVKSLRLCFDPRHCHIITPW